MCKESKGVKVRRNVTRKGKKNVEMSPNISGKQTFPHCGCFNLFCDVWVCVGVGFVMCGGAYVWVFW
jgi:hypothetical protein